MSASHQVDILNTFMGSSISVAVPQNTRVVFTAKIPTINQDQVTLLLKNNDNLSPRYGITIGADANTHVIVTTYNATDGTVENTENFDYAATLNTDVTYNLDFSGTTLSLWVADTTDSPIFIMTDVDAINVINFTSLNNGSFTYTSQAEITVTSSAVVPATCNNTVWIVLIVLALLAALAGLGTTIYFWQKLKHQ